MNRHSIALVLLATVSWTSFGGSTDDPKNLVAAFVADYFVWNAHAISISHKEKDNSGNAMKLAEKSYMQLIGKYCRPGFKYQPISFGDESSHEPGKEVIVAEQVNGNLAVIRTKHKGLYGFESIFEYRFSRESSRWYLDAVDYVDKDGKYPGL